MELKVFEVYNRPVHSYLAVFQVFQTGTEDTNIFVCRDVVRSSSSSAEEPVSEGSSSSPSTDRPFVLYPDRNLVSVASLTDLQVLPLTAPSGSLYRASTVAMLFRSEDGMRHTVAEVVGDVKINAKLQRSPLVPSEVIDLKDPVYGKDDEVVFAL